MCRSQLQEAVRLLEKWYRYGGNIADFGTQAFLARIRAGSDSSSEEPKP